MDFVDQFLIDFSIVFADVREVGTDVHYTVLTRSQVLDKAILNILTDRFQLSIRDFRNGAFDIFIVNHLLHFVMHEQFDVLTVTFVGDPCL